MTPIWGWGEFGWSGWYTVKVIHIKHNLFAGTEFVCSLRLRANRHARFVRGYHPPFGLGVELRGRMWYLVEFLHIRHNLFAGTIFLRLRTNRNTTFA